MTEEERAALYRDQARRREAFQAFLKRALAGSEVAKAVLHAKQRPFLDYIRDRRSY